MNNIINDIGYTGIGEIKSKSNNFLSRDLHGKVAKIENGIVNEEENDGLHGEGMNTIIPSIIIDNYTWLGVLLGLKLSRHTDTLKKVGNFMGEVYKRGEIDNDQQNWNDPDEFSAQ